MYSACIVWDPQGQAVARQGDKIHLFCFDNGRERYDGPRCWKPGSSPSASCDQPGRRAFPVGLAICYDLRSPNSSGGGRGDEALDAIVLRPRSPPQAWPLEPAAARPRGGEPVPCAGHRPGLASTPTAGAPLAITGIAPWGEVQALLEEGQGVVMGEWSRDELARCASGFAKPCSTGSSDTCGIRPASKRPGDAWPFNRGNQNQAGLPREAAITTDPP